MGRTPGGIAVAFLHYKADPDLTPDRLAELRKLYSSDAFWKKEMEMDASALRGSLVYPEYDENIHVVPDEAVPKRGCRFMSIDPHPRTPHAFLWVIIDRWSDWYVYREMWPSIAYGRSGRLHDDDQENFYTVKDYAETMAHMEGNYIEWHKAETDKEFGVYRRNHGGEKIVFRLMDQAGKGFRAGDESQLLESYAKRYNRFGVRCIDPKKSHHTGEDAIRGLLKPRLHDLRGTFPKLHIAESCIELRHEMRNYRYAKTKTPSDERDLKQEAAQARSHQIDNLRYLATSVAQYSRWNES